MNYDLLKTFVTVAEKKSFSKAAYILHLSQPTITSHIKRLESELELTLFKRSTKQISLTQAGKLLYRYATDIINLYDKAKSELSAFALDTQKKLNLACSFTVGETILTAILQQIKKEFPHLLVNIELLPINQIIELIKSGVIDAGFSEQAAFGDEEIQSDPFHADEFVFACAPNFFPKTKASITISELNKIPLILPSHKSRIRSLIDKYLVIAKKNGIQYEQIFQSDQIALIKAAVVANLGCTILPKSSIQMELELNKLVAFSLIDFPHKIYYHLLYHKSIAATKINTLNRVLNMTNYN